MPTIESPSAEVKLLETLKKLHETTTSSLDELERTGTTAVPIDNVRQITGSYMKIMLQLVSLSLIKNNAGEMDSDRRDQRSFLFTMATLAVGVTLGAFLSAALLLGLA